MLMPTSTNYQDAIQNPMSCFRDADLQQSLPKTNKLGLPIAFSGSFAVVFPMTGAGRKWAVRCFLTYQQDQEPRYEKISQYLKQKQPSWMVGFDYLKQGIKVNGNWYPILKMEWIDGETLNNYIQNNSNDGQQIQLLPQKFLQLVHELRRDSIAHGDLQHGNILLVNGRLKLVDYDGMYVPGLDGMPSNELGHRNYQHPSRTAHDFGLNIDNFSAWSIYVTLLALSFVPELCRLVNAADDHLLLKREDINDPASSHVLHSLKAINDTNFQSIINLFHNIIYSSDISNIPPLSDRRDMMTSVKPSGADLKTETPDTNLSWIIDHLKIPDVRVPVPSFIEKVYAKVSIVASICLLVFSLIGVSLKITITIPIIMGIFSLVLLTLNNHFKSKPEISEMKKLSSKMDFLKAEINNIQSILNKLDIDKNNENQTKVQKINVIESKQSEQAQLERNAIGKVDADLNSNLSNISSKRQELNKLEHMELQTALKNIQEHFLANKLQQHKLSSQTIQGIGTEMTARLFANGIKTAADISNIHLSQSSYRQHKQTTAYIVVPGRGNIHVEGIGPVKAQSLLDWRNRLAGHYSNSAPRNLPSAQESTIKSKYALPLQALNVQEGDLRQNANRARISIKEKYLTEQKKLKSQLVEVQKSYAEKIEKLESRILLEKKTISQKSYSFVLLENQLKPYSQIKFSNYIKHAAWF